MGWLAKCDCKQFFKISYVSLHQKGIGVDRYIAPLCKVVNPEWENGDVRHSDR